MAIPDPDPARNPFRFQVRWIAWFVVFDLLIAGVVLRAVLSRRSGEVVELRLDPSGLWLGDERLSPLVVNPRDSLPDFPDSVWRQDVLWPLWTRIHARKDLDQAVFRVRAAPSIPFVTLNTVIDALRSAEARSLELSDSVDALSASLHSGKPLVASDGRLLLGTGDRKFVLLMTRPDTLVFFASQNGNVVVRIRRWPADSALRDSLDRWKAWFASDDSIGILPAPSEPFARVFATAKLFRELTGRNAWIAQRSIALEGLLANVLDSVELEKRWSSDSTGGGTGARLEGLDRIHFRRQALGAFVVDAARSLLPWLPESLQACVAMPVGGAEDPDLGSYSCRDFRLPQTPAGHSLVFREVQFRGLGLKGWPIWWALYENGKRTSVWTFEGGMVNGKILANYQVDKIRPLGLDGFRIQVKGESYRNGSWTEKGVELDFAFTGRDFQLSKVGNRFGWFDGDVFATEDSAAGGWIERRAENPPASLLHKCGYRDPRREGSPEFDWDRNLRIARCITAWPGAKSTFRATGEKSFIER